VSGGQPRVVKPQIVQVDLPTVVAFWKFDRQRDAAIAQGDEAEALSDFQFYAGNEKDLFRKHGIHFYEIYDTSFTLKIKNQISVIRAKQFDNGVGYYLIAPNKKPQIIKGVMTDSDLLEAAEKYFSAAVK
jgi:hypothetical protein